VDFLNYISRFKFVLAVPIGDVRIRGEYDGQHQERGKGGTGQLQAPGPVKGKERMIYVARVTNLPEVLELYDGVRNPMEPADQGLPALHELHQAFRFLTFVLAVLLYSLLPTFKVGR